MVLDPEQALNCTRRETKDANIPERWPIKGPLQTKVAMTDRNNLHLKLFIYHLESNHLDRAPCSALAMHQFCSLKEFADVGTVQMGTVPAPGARTSSS